MSRHRLLFILGLAASWFLAVGARLYQIQVIRHDSYRERAEGQQNLELPLTPPRATIYDRRGRQLAVSVEVRSVAADPTRVEDAATTARALGRVLDVDVAKLTKDLESDRFFVWVERKLEPPVAKQVEDLELDGVFLVAENKRYYPLKTLAAQILGYVGTDNKGLAGLEYLYDPVVASEPGKRTVVRDARAGTVVHPSYEVSEARPGQDVHLTIDARIQHVVEQELARGIESSHAKRGIVVVMDPHTGAVLAMAAHPTYDPNRFAEFPKETWRNKAVTDAYEPGSTFKMITVAAALEAMALEPDDVFDCEHGSIRFGKTVIKDHASFGVLTVHDIIAKSSNVGAIKIGHAAGRRRFYDTIRAFGFGKTTGVDLPSESPGILWPIEKWSELSPAYQSFGHGISVTAIQLTNAFAAIANGGRLLRPFVVERVGDGEPRRREVLGLPISPSSVSQVRAMLEGVVEEGGTATSAAIVGYPAAGKTGTAQKPVNGGYSSTLHVASFVGFVPVDEPALVVTVILDEPWPRYHGGQVAAPVFQAIAEKTLLYLGAQPKRELPERWPGEEKVARRPPAPLPERAGSQEGRLPDFAGLSLRQALARSSRLGLGLELEGHGDVVRQTPAPGTPLEAAGRQVKLWLGHQEGP